MPLWAGRTLHMEKLPKKTLAGSTGGGPPKIGEIGKAVADAGYSKSMALLLAT